MIGCGVCNRNVDDLLYLNVTAFQHAIRLGFPPDEDAPIAQGDVGHKLIGQDPIKLWIENILRLPRASGIM